MYNNKGFKFFHKDGRKLILRSPLEVVIANKLNRHSSLRWDYESIRIDVPKKLQKEVGAKYLIPDFQLYFPCGEKWMIEAKGRSRLEDYLKKKSKIVDDFCKEKGFNYEIVLNKMFNRHAEFDENDVGLFYPIVDNWFARTKYELEQLEIQEDMRVHGEDLKKIIYGFDY